jgi:putative ABC transport system permease protein
MNFKIAIRALRKRPSFALIAIAALALGIGLNTAIFSVVEAVLLRSLPFPHPDELIRVSEWQKSFGHVGTADPNFEDWSHQAHTIAAASEFRPVDYTLSGTGDAERLRALEVSSGFFATTGVFPALGRTFRADEDRTDAPGAVVITDGLWRRRFGADPSAIGRAVDLNGKAFTIIGVMPPAFTMPTLPCDILVPAGLKSDNQRGSHRGEAFARLRPGITLRQAQAEFASISSRLAKAYPPTNSDWSLEVTPLRESVVSDVRPALLIVLGAVGLVLLIACANVANLLLVRASERRREIAVRAVLGASRTQIAMQLLVEALILSLAGGLLGISLASWMLRSLVAMVPVEIATMDFSLNTPVLFFTLGVSLLTGIAFGLLPALGSSAPNLTTSLKEGGRSATAGESRNRLRSALASAEIGFAVVLAVGAGLLVKSFANLQRVNPGFQPPSVITMRVSLPEARYTDDAATVRFWDRLLDSAQQWNGTRAAGLTSFLPLTDTDSQTGYIPEGEAPPARLADKKWVDIATVSPGYFAAMGIPLQQGRTFEATDDATHPAVVIVDDSLARKHWPGQNPAGKRIHVSAGKLRTIVGVAGHVKPYGLDAGEHAQVYLPYRQVPTADMSLAVRTSGNWAAAVDQVRQTVRQLDPAAGIFDVKPMQQWVDDSTSRRRFTTLLLEMFAGVALLLAALGVYGVMSYSVAQRSHEMGIRLALGAKPAGLKRMVVRQGLTLCAIGLGAGLVAALALARMMTAVLFEVHSFDPLIFGATAALLCAVAVAASYLPARRASRTDPMNTLRYE